MSTKPPPLPDEELNTDWESEGGRTLADPTMVAIGDPVTAPHDVATLAAGLRTRTSPRLATGATGRASPTGRLIAAGALSL